MINIDCLYLCVVHISLYAENWLALAISSIAGKELEQSKTEMRDKSSKKSIKKGWKEPLLTQAKVKLRTNSVPY